MKTHTKDSDCTLDAMNCCIECSALHLEPCEHCGQRGYHKPSCDVMLDEMIHEAKYEQERTNIRHFVLWSVADGRYVVTDYMPFVGEWYTSDGIQHGPTEHYKPF